MLLRSDYYYFEEYLLMKKTKRMLETFLILYNKFLSLTLFQMQSRRSVESRVHNFFFSKLIGNHLLKSPCVGVSFLAALKGFTKGIGKHL